MDKTNKNNPSQKTIMSNFRRSRSKDYIITHDISNNDNRYDYNKENLLKYTSTNPQKNDQQYNLNTKGLRTLNMSNKNIYSKNTNDSIINRTLNKDDPSSSGRPLNSMNRLILDPIHNRPPINSKGSLYGSKNNLFQRKESIHNRDINIFGRYQNPERINYSKERQQMDDRVSSLRSKQVGRDNTNSSMNNHFSRDGSLVVDKSRLRQDSSLDHAKHSLIVKLTDIEIDKEIGKGSYAVVKLGSHKVSREKFAVKIYEKSKLLDPLKKKSVEREISILQKIDHPSIIRYISHIDTKR